MNKFDQLITPLTKDQDTSTDKFVTALKTLHLWSDKLTRTCLNKCMDMEGKHYLEPIWTSYHRCLLLKLDIQPRSHLLIEFCIQWGICTAPPPPLQALCLLCCMKCPVDGVTNLFV